MTKLTKKTCAIHAKSIREAAKRFLANGLECFKGNNHMILVYRKDGADLRNVAKLLRAGDVERACDMADHLDTLVREVIPEEAWNVLHGRESGNNGW